MNRMTRSEARKLEWAEGKRAEAYKNRIYKDKLCDICETNFTPSNGIEKRCSKKCRLVKEQMRGAIRRTNPKYRVESSKRATAWQKTQKGRDYQWSFVRKKKGTWKTPCLICGELRFTQRCHIVPRSKGGTDDPNNLLVLCPTHHIILDNFLMKLRGNQFTEEEYQIIGAKISKAQLIIDPRII